MNAKNALFHGETFEVNIRFKKVDVVKTSRNKMSLGVKTGKSCISR